MPWSLQIKLHNIITQSKYAGFEQTQTSNVQHHKAKEQARKTIKSTMVA